LAGDRQRRARLCDPRRRQREVTQEVGICSPVRQPGVPLAGQGSQEQTTSLGAASDHGAYRQTPDVLGNQRVESKGLVRPTGHRNLQVALGHRSIFSRFEANLRSLQTAQRFAGQRLAGIGLVVGGLMAGSSADGRPIDQARRVATSGERGRRVRRRPHGHAQLRMASRPRRRPGVDVESSLDRQLRSQRLESRPQLPAKEE